MVELPAELELVFRRQDQARRLALGAEARGVLVADRADRAAALDLDEIEPRPVAARIGARLVTVAAGLQRLELAPGVELMAMRALVALEPVGFVVNLVREVHPDDEHQRDQLRIPPTRLRRKGNRQGAKPRQARQDSPWKSLALLASWR